MIIGITGTAGSGKDTLADILRSLGFEYYSCSDILRDECKKLGIESNRDNLIMIGNRLRSREGYGTLAVRILKKIIVDGVRNAVVVSIRHPDEVKILKKHKGFKLVFVDAPIKLRYERIQKRVGRPEDKVTFEQFAAQEKRECQTSGPGQQLKVVAKLADYAINNEGTFEDFNQKILLILNRVGLKIKELPKKKEAHRPDWDTYFMNITKEVAQRCNCMTVKIGATIVKNGTIISTGYAGAPRGTKDCYNRGSCLRRELNIPSGHRYELCRSVHAEQNAIINAAREGHSVLGGDIYVWGVRRYSGEEKLINALPCFICKKIILNAGLKRFIGSREDGSLKTYNVEDWQKRWQVFDMTEDMDVHSIAHEKKTE